MCQTAVYQGEGVEFAPDEGVEQPDFQMMKELKRKHPHIEGPRR